MLTCFKQALAAGRGIPDASSDSLQGGTGRRGRRPLHAAFRSAAGVGRPGATGRGARQGELPQRGKRRCPGVRPRRAYQPPSPQGRISSARSLPPTGGRCPSAHTGADEGLHVLTPGCPSRDGPARPGPPFLPEEMGRKKGRGASPALGPPVRGLMAAVGCTEKARAGRASTPSSFFVPVTGAAAPWAARIDHPASPDHCHAVPAWPAGPPPVPCR